MDDRQADTRRPLIAGNWKMHKLPSEANAWTREFIAKLDESVQATGPLTCDVALAVPYTHLPGMSRQAYGSRLWLGAQDVSAHAEGAYTGEVSAAMLKDTGARCVVVGHSERRAYHGEDDALVKQKVLRSLEVGLTPILCVGESRAQRDAGDAEAVVVAQLGRALDGVTLSDAG
ncbi:MAG TPA: triose-phosphate isomerase, partial [Trueperaceae bacterium]|nr:triose-phosphate isomerase [Trueperaceae bacterium]